MKNVLVIDNYDSFTYNLFQYLAELGADDHLVPVVAQRLGQYLLAVAFAVGVPGVEEVDS